MRTQPTGPLPSGTLPRRGGGLALLQGIVLWLLVGCAGAPIDLASIEGLPPNEGVAFGRVKLLADGEPQNLSSFMGESQLTVFILPDDSSEAMRFPLKDDGSFFWHLPPGGYTIATFEGLTPEFFSVHVKGRLFANFDVEEDTATYIGTLGLRFRGSRYDAFIEDDFGHAFETFTTRFPEFRRKTRKRLMTFERPR